MDWFIRKWSNVAGRVEVNQARGSEISRSNLVRMSLQGSALEEFNAVANKNFREQGIAFLNAYWNEVEDQADFIFEVAYAHFRMAEMVGCPYRSIGGNVDVKVRVLCVHEYMWICL